MRFRFVAVATGLVVLGGCKTSAEKEDVSCAELEGLTPLVDDEAGKTSPPCDIDGESGYPYLEMPRSEVMETYLSSMSAIDTLAIDYMVHPATRVLGGTSAIESDVDSEAAPLGIGECASEIPVSAIFAEAQADDVHVARVRLDEPDDASRSARVFASRGERTITLDTTGVAA